MSYSVLIIRRAEKELAQVPLDRRAAVVDAVRTLGSDPRPPGSSKLAGRDGWRIRVEPYRVLYDNDDSRQSLTSLHVGHRKDVFR